MLPQLSPSESVRRFSFNGTDCLYRDHLGRRVVADVEGFGSFSVQSEAKFTLVGQEGGVEMFDGTFTTFLVVAALEPGPIEVVVFLGRTTPVAGKIESVSLPFEGIGWFAGSSSAVELDDRHETISADLPFPFFRSIQGTGDAKIIRAEGKPFQLVDAFDIGDEQALKERKFKVQNISKLFDLGSTFPDGTPLAAKVASHLNAAVWRCSKPKGTTELNLRKTYDAFHGRQRAKVYVDGQVRGWWYEAGENRKNRWAVSDFGIIDPSLSDLEEIEIKIDPPGGSQLWSISRFELFAR